MKREAINSNESQLNEDMLQPLIDNMLREREEGVERVNKMFGTNIKVHFNSAWEQNEIEEELALQEMETVTYQAEEAPAEETTEETSEGFIDDSIEEQPAVEFEEDETEEVPEVELTEETIEAIAEKVEEVIEEKEGEEDVEDT